MIPTILCDMPARAPVTRDDWGDNETIGIHLRRRRSWSNLNASFGVFLGDNSVGLKDFLTWRIWFVEHYETTEEMKRNWEAD